MKDAMMGKTADEIVSFGDMYEDFLNTRLSNALEEYDPDFVENVRSNLVSKRSLGREKYGSTSFQTSFENSMNAPIREHFIEEILDAMNYILHMMFVSETRGDDSMFLYITFSQLADIYAEYM